MNEAPPVEVLKELWQRDDHGHLGRLVERSGGPVVVARAARGDARLHEEALRAELCGLDASLLLFDPTGLWRLRHDEPMERVTIDRVHRPLSPVEAAGLLGLEDDARAGLALLLLDASGRARFRHVQGTPSRDGVAALVATLRAVGHSLRLHTSGRLLAASYREVMMVTMAAAFARTLGNGRGKAPFAPKEAAVSGPASFREGALRA